jgi:type IV pilus assembly protein PilE
MRTLNHNGFTLVELMVTVAILGVVASIAIPAYNGYIITSRKSECQNEVASIKLAESEYFLDNNSYFGATTGAVADLKSASGGIYEPSAAAAGANSECVYKVTTTATTFTITADHAAGGHLTSETNPIVTLTGP